VSVVVPVSEFIADEGYPGMPPEALHAPFVVEPFGRFTQADEQRFWFLDFHWPRGLTPMGLIWNQDGYSWGTQLAAAQMPLPRGHGITQRLAGTHTYASAIPVESPHEIQARGERLRAYLPRFLNDFDGFWQRRLDEIEGGWQHLSRTDTATASLTELAAMLREARTFHRRSFEIHFEVMYPLLALYLGFRGLCTELGIDPAEVARFLEPGDTLIMQTDRELWRLTAAARGAGLESLFARTEPERLAAELSAAGGSAIGWCARFSEFLSARGHRTEGTCDIALPSWVEDPTPALGSIKTFLQQGTDHDFEAAARVAAQRRDEALDAARSRLTRPEQNTFDAALASMQSVNFARWQDDHNVSIDLRVALPMRWAALAIAERVGADRRDDTLFLFWPELLAVADGERDYDGFRSIVQARRQYFEHWHERRASMPKVLGTIPDTVDDPILIEIFGLNRQFLAAVEATGRGGRLTTLSGIGAASGRARGIARVLSDADALHRLLPGEVLVCESTSPNWTPAFAKIAACVCDGGGTLSHAAIVGREYGVPTVTACGTATLQIRDGDEVEVDGDLGTVHILGRPGG